MQVVILAREADLHTNYDEETSVLTEGAKRNRYSVEEAEAPLGLSQEGVEVPVFKVE